MVTDARLFTTPPNWSEAFQVTYQYATDILVSRSGKEQRSATRQTPRKSMSFETMVHDEGLRAFNRFMAASLHVPVVMPEFTRSVLTTSSMAPSAFSVNVASIPQWLQVGRTVVLVNGAQKALREVQSIASLAVTFDSSDTLTWGVGTMVYSGVIGHLAPEIRGMLLTNTVAEPQVGFSADPGLEPVDTVPAAATTFNGREIFPFAPNWRSGLDVTHSHPRETIDYGRGRINTITPVAFSTRLFRVDIWGKTAAQVEAIREFFDRQRGRRGEFYVPTYENDLPLKVAASSGATSFRVAGTDAADDYDGDTTRQAVCIVQTNGTRIYAKVSSVSISSGDSLVNLTAGLPADIDPETTVLISWMPACRLASDEMTIVWRTTQVAEVTLPIQSLEDRTGS